MKSYLREKSHGLAWDCSSELKDMLAMSGALSLIICVPQVKWNIRLNYDLIYEKDTYKKEPTWRRLVTHTIILALGRPKQDCKFQTSLDYLVMAYLEKKW